MSHSLTHKARIYICTFRLTQTLLNPPPPHLTSNHTTCIRFATRTIRTTIKKVNLRKTAICVATLVAVLSGLTNVSGTWNQLIDGSQCRNVTLIFAQTYDRNKGIVSHTTGPRLTKFLSQAIGADGLAVRGVNYPFNLAWQKGPETSKMYDDADETGVKETMRLINVTQKRCPNTKLVLAGKG